MEFESLNKELRKAVEQAEDYAIAYLQEKIDFSPYLFFGNNKIQKIVADDVDEAIEMAHNEIEKLNNKCIVFVYQDIIELADGSFDAIISQVFDIDEDTAFSFGQVYRFEEDKISFLNERIFLGEVRNSLVYGKKMKIFYLDYDTDEEIPSDDPIEKDLEDAIDIFYDLDGGEDNFFGLVDDNDNCIQFVCLDEDEWEIDIPFKELPEHLRYADYEKCISIIKQCYLENKIIDLGD